MRTSTFSVMSALAAGTILLASCESSPYPGYEQAESGLFYKFHKQDEKGAKPAAGSVVTVRMLYKNDKDSLMFNSKDMSRDGSGTITFPLSESTFKGSFEDALFMMAAGDSASFLISADSLFAKTFKQPEAQPPATKGTLLTFEAALVKFISKEEAQKEQEKKMAEQQAIMEKMKAEEGPALAKYIADNKITAKPTASGLYYIEVAKGKGKKVQVGDTVQVQYKGMFLDGQVFDSSEGSPAPIEFAIGVGAVIKGWDEGIPMMNVGGKAKLIIPSEIGYGPMGAQGRIPPYAPLAFEVEVVGVKGK